MASVNRHPTGDTGIGAAIETRRIRTAQDLVADVSAAETEMMVGAAVSEGAMVQTPTPPTKMDRKLGVADRTDTKEVSWCRQDDGLNWDRETSVGLAIGAHMRRWVQPFGAHRRDDRLRGMGKPPWASYWRPKEKVGPDIWHPQEKGKHP